MPGQKILEAELKQIARQDEGVSAGYDVYVDNYPNYGDWYDCSSYH